MNPDISDILASIDRPAHSDYPGGHAPPSSLSDPSQTYLDHQSLTRFWISERSCPEVLPWPTELMQRVLERIRSQIQKIEDFAASHSDPSFSNDPISGDRGAGISNPNLTLSILQTDLSRTQYILRSLLRCRLSKLSKHAMHYLSRHRSQTQASDSGSQLRSESLPTSRVSGPLLVSPSESYFLSQSQSLLQTYYSTSFLSSLPSSLQRLDDNAGGINMVEGPDLKQAVFVRCLADRWRSTDPSRHGSEWVSGGGESGASGGAHDDKEAGDEDEDEDEDRERDFDMSKGQVWVVRWEDVRKGVLSGKLELL